MDFVVRSRDIHGGQPIPKQFTGDGADDSPQLSWQNVPEGTVELALIVEDPDAPNGDFVHWVAYKIPPSLTEIPRGVPPGQQAPTAQGRNDFGKTGYRGPAPPPGKVHHYHFRLMALNQKTNLPPNADKGALRVAVKGHVIAEAELVGTYQR